MSLSLLIDDVILLICHHLKTIEIKTLLILYTKDENKRNHLYRLINLKYNYLIDLYHMYPAIWEFYINNKEIWNNKFPHYPLDRQLINNQGSNELDKFFLEKNGYELMELIFHCHEYKELSKLFILSNEFKGWISPINIFAFIGLKFEVGTNDQINMALEMILLQENWLDMFISQIRMLLLILLKNINITNEITYLVLDFIVSHKHHSHYNLDNILCAIKESQHPEKDKLIKYLTG